MTADVRVLMTPGTFQLVEQRARERGMSASAWVRLLIVLYLTNKLVRVREEDSA